MKNFLLYFYHQINANSEKHQYQINNWADYYKSFVAVRKEQEENSENYIDQEQNNLKDTENMLDSYVADNTGPEVDTVEKDNKNFVTHVGLINSDYD